MSDNEAAKAKAKTMSDRARTMTDRNENNERQQPQHFSLFKPKAMHIGQQTRYPQHCSLALCVSHSRPHELASACTIAVIEQQKTVLHLHSFDIRHNNIIVNDS